MIRIYTIILSIIIFCCGISKTYGQQDLLLSNILSNNIHLNPSNVGFWLNKDKTFSTDGTYRSQWIGFEGAPKTTVINVEGRLNDYNTAVGLTLIQDKIGIENKYEIAGSYAYQLRFRNSMLAIGLRTGMTLFKTRFEDLDNQSDYDFQELDGNFMQWSVGLGISYQDEHITFSAGVPSVVSFNNSLANLKQRHYYIQASFKIGDYYNTDIIVEPLLHFRFHESTRFQTNIGVIFWINENIFPSLQYRMNESIIMGLGTKVLNNVTASLSYDLIVNEIRPNTYGSLEINVSYSF